MNIRYIILQFPLILWAKVKVLAVLPALSLISYDIGGDKVSVESLFDKPFDVHYISIKPSQAFKIQSADLIVSTSEFAGLLSQYTDNLVFIDKALASPQSCSCQHHEGHDHASHGSKLLSHEWLSFYGTKIFGQSIRDKLIELDSENRDYYQGRFQDFTVEIDRLKDEFTDRKALSDKVFLHDSFFHFESETSQSYGVVLKKCHETSITPSVLQEIISSDDYKILVAEQPFDKFMIDKVLARTSLSFIELDTLGYEASAIHEKPINSASFIEKVLSAIYQ